MHDGHRRFGFRPLIIALSWIGLELLLLPLGLRRSLLVAPQESGHLLSLVSVTTGYAVAALLVARSHFDEAVLEISSDGVASDGAFEIGGALFTNVLGRPPQQSSMRKARSWFASSAGGKLWRTSPPPKLRIYPTKLH